MSRGAIKPDAIVPTASVPTASDDPAERFDIHAVRDSFVECRTLGHAWRRVRVEVRGATATMDLQCSRCRTRRSDRIGHRGTVDGRSYDYPDGYTHKGLTVERHEYRYELVLRVAAVAPGNGVENE